jgi:hypothetical protein
MISIDKVSAQPDARPIASTTIDPIFLQSSAEVEQIESHINNPKYALLSANQLKKAAFYLYKNPDKLGHRVMWFYHQRDLKNIAGLESATALGFKLHNLGVPETRAQDYFKEVVESGHVGCGRP